MTSRIDSIWHREVTVEEINDRGRQSMLEHLDIRFTEIGSDYLRGTMPVDHRTIQPFGILHGGASVVLAETLGSMAANLCVDPAEKMAVGLDVSANHIRQVSGGWVTGTARPLHLGGRTQVWEIRVEAESRELVSISRLTVIVLRRSREAGDGDRPPTLSRER